MDTGEERASLTGVLRQAIETSGLSHNALAKGSGVDRASIIRFARGDQSIRLDKADKLAEYFGLELQKRD